MHKWLQIAVRALGLAAVLSVLGYPGASAQQVVRPAFVNGEVLITVPGGTARAAVDQIAAAYNLQVRQAFPNIDGQGARDVYHLRMNAANPTAEQTTALLAQLRADVDQSVRQSALRRQTAAQDIAWALVNSPAFLFNH